MTWRRLGWLGVLLRATIGAAWAEDFQGGAQRVEYEGEPIKYFERVPADAVARLQHRLATGEATLAYDDRFGYLPAVLEALQVPAASQALVFSKTSQQRNFIRPENPRALYFSDEVYVGFIPGAPALEVAATDPQLGGVFYHLDNEKVRRPRFVRDQDCLRCHGAEKTLGVPGFLVRSVGTDRHGELEPVTEVGEMDHCSPLADRWAGWYVTGRHGTQTHRGNLVGASAFAQAAREPNFRGNLADATAFFPAEKHLRATSDIVAQMVLAHQAKMHNYLTRLRYETQRMMTVYGHIRYLRNQENAFLRYLLFTEEAPLVAPVVGLPEYARYFTAQGPFDGRGRSLREFDLQRRLFRYPCSFLIYSPQFDALPAVMHDRLLQRLHAILTGEDRDPQFARLNDGDRRVILEILRETKPGLPPAWLEPAAPPAATP